MKKIIILALILSGVSLVSCSRSGSMPGAPGNNLGSSSGLNQQQQQRASPTSTPSY